MVDGAGAKPTGHEVIYFSSSVCPPLFEDFSAQAAGWKSPFEESPYLQRKFDFSSDQTDMMRG